MAGRNQHDIPQALLRGFRIPGSSNKESKTWLYEKGIEPRPEFIKDEVAVERHFYSEPSSDGSRTLDDEITDFETALGRRLHKLKNAPVEQTVHADNAAERERVDAWATKQSDGPTRSEAIRRLIEHGLEAVARAKPVSKPGRRLRAQELATKAIEKLIDPAAPPKERAQRRRRLTKGPPEFREDRIDLPKAKGK